jgi:hypothetical protein
MPDAQCQKLFTPLFAARRPWPQMCEWPSRPDLKLAEDRTALTVLGLEKSRKDADRLVASYAPETPDQDSQVPWLKPADVAAVVNKRP